MNALKQLMMLVIAPNYGWQAVKDDHMPSHKLVSGLYLPLLAVLAASCMIQLIYNNELTLSLALVDAIVAFSAYFFTYHIANIALAYIYPSAQTDANDGQHGDDSINTMLVYLLSYLVIIRIISNLLPSDFIILHFLAFYICFIIYKGLSYIRCTERPKFTIAIITALTIITPAIISWLLHSVLPSSN